MSDRVDFKSDRGLRAWCLREAQRICMSDRLSVALEAAEEIYTFVTLKDRVNNQDRGKELNDE